MKYFISIFLIFGLYTNCLSQVYNEKINCQLKFKKNERFKLPDSLQTEGMKVNLFVRVYFDSLGTMKNISILVLRKRILKTNEVLFEFKQSPQSFEKNVDYPEGVRIFYEFLKIYLKNEVIFEFPENFNLKKDFVLDFFFRYPLYD